MECRVLETSFIPFCVWNASGHIVAAGIVQQEGLLRGPCQRKDAKYGNALSRIWKISIQQQYSIAM